MIVRLRYVGASPATIACANVFGPRRVTPGEVFEFPSIWLYALEARGTPIERVSDEAPAGEAIASAKADEAGVDSILDTKTAHGFAPAPAEVVAEAPARPTPRRRRKGAVDGV